MRTNPDHLTNRTSGPMLALAGALFIASPLLTTGVVMQTAVTGTRADDPEAREQRNSSAIAVILGDLRANLGDLIFIKTERYLDNGIAYMPHLDTEAMTASGTIQTSGTSAEDAQKKMLRGVESEDMADTARLRPDQKVEEKPHEIVPTIIKTMDQDYRGFIGNLEREVKPWRDPRLPHQHTAGSELLPWYRLATMSDPHNVRCYMIGAWWLKSMHNPKQIAEALGFIDEGIRNNPGSFQLYNMKGLILREMGQPGEADRAFRSAVDLGIRQRPPDGATTPQWTETMEETLDAAMVMTVLYARDTQSTASAVALARQYSRRVGNVGVIDGLLTRLEKK